MPVFDVMSAGYIFPAICDFDVENDGWRSFRWDSITNIEFSLVGVENE